MKCEKNDPWWIRLVETTFVCPTIFPRCIHTSWWPPHLRFLGSTLMISWLSGWGASLNQMSCSSWDQLDDHTTHPGQDDSHLITSCQSYHPWQCWDAWGFPHLATLGPPSMIPWLKVWGTSPNKTSCFSWNKLDNHTTHPGQDDNYLITSCQSCHLWQ